MVSPRFFARVLGVFVAFTTYGFSATQRAPNVIVIFTDDQGHGDLGCQGSRDIRTPHLDRMAAEGARFTDFYVPSAICTPSRAALLTGRYPPRYGLGRGVFFPKAAGGLPSEEVTLAEVVKPAGYATAAIGKWHLGDRPEYLPTSQGFDVYWGIPYSNDMDALPGVKTTLPKMEEAWRDPAAGTRWWNVPILSQTAEIERPADQRTLTKRYTDETIRFIEANREKPFFVYLAHSMPHVPVFVQDEHHVTDSKQAYRLAIEEIDASTGRIREALEHLGLAENTLVIFSSDNGPWAEKGHFAGSSGGLRGSKRGVYEGGVRVPGIFWWPARIPAGQTVRVPATTLDVLPTVAAASGAALPERPLDGVNLLPLLTTGEALARRGPLVFFHTGTAAPQALRDRDWKFVAGAQGLELYDLASDPSEETNLAASRADVVADLSEKLRLVREEFPPPPAPRKPASASPPAPTL